MHNYCMGLCRNLAQNLFTNTFVELGNITCILISWQEYFGLIVAKVLA